MGGVGPYGTPHCMILVRIGDKINSKTIVCERLPHFCTCGQTVAQTAPEAMPASLAPHSHKESIIEVGKAAL